MLYIDSLKPILKKRKKKAASSQPPIYILFKVIKYNTY